MKKRCRGDVRILIIASRIYIVSLLNRNKTLLQAAAATQQTVDHPRYIIIIRVLWWTFVVVTLWCGNFFFMNKCERALPQFHSSSVPSISSLVRLLAAIQNLFYILYTHTHTLILTSIYSSTKSVLWSRCCARACPHVHNMHTGGGFSLS